MAVYKLIPSNATTKSKPAGTDGTNNDGAFSNDKHNYDSTTPDVTVGIAAGSVAGFGLLVLLVFLGARWLVGRRRQQARIVRGITSSSAATSTTASITTSTTAGEDEKNVAAVIREATRVDLRRLDSVVMDQHHQSGASRTGIGAAATAATGAEWQGVSGASPLTPRTPRHVDEMGPLEEEQDGMTTTPSTRVLPPLPDRIALTRGLGERAWHRRRLSVPFPPAVGQSVAEGEGGGAGGMDDGYGLPSRSSAGGSWCTEEEDESQSWRWTLSTEGRDRHEGKRSK